MRVAPRIDERGMHSGGSERGLERKPPLKATWVGKTQQEDPDDEGRVYRVGSEINVHVAAWVIDVNLQLGDVVYLTGDHLKAARLGRIAGFHEEIAPHFTDDVGLWMQLEPLWRPEHLKPGVLPDDIEVHEREVFLQKGELINAHVRMLELQARPKVMELHEPAALPDSQHLYFYRRTYSPAIGPIKAEFKLLPAPPTAATEAAGGAVPMETDEAEATAASATEPATAGSKAQAAPRRNAAKEVDALKARVLKLEEEKRAQEVEIEDLRSQVSELVDLMGRVAELEQHMRAV